MNNKILKLEHIPYPAYDLIIQYLSLEDIRNLLRVNKDVYYIVSYILGSRKEALTGNPTTISSKNFLNIKIYPKVKNIVILILKNLENASTGDIYNCYNCLSDNDFNLIYKFKPMANTIWNDYYENINNSTNRYEYIITDYYKNAIKNSFKGLEDIARRRYKRFNNNYNEDDNDSIYDNNNKSYLWSLKYTFIVVMWLYMFH